MVDMGAAMIAETFLIEDVETTRALLRMILTQGPYRVAGEAGTLLSALQKLTKTKVDLVILDLEMPDGNGINVIPRLLEMHPAATIVVASAHNDAESVKGALEAGAHGYLIKPFTPSVLDNTISRAWRRSGKQALPETQS